MRRWSWVALVAVGCAVLTVGPGTSAARADQPTVAPTGPVVLIGVPDLQWQDVTADATPALWQLAGTSSIGAMTDQSGEGDARRAAGWMTLNTGSRAVAFFHPARSVPDPSDPVQLARLTEINRVSRFHPTVGALGDALHHAGRKVAAVYGSGAVLGGMTSKGTVDVRASSVPDALRQGADVVVVELPQLYDVDREYPAGADAVRHAVAEIDAAVGAIQRELPSGSSLLVAGVSDGYGGQAHLHVAMAHGPQFGPGRLTSSSTGRSGVVQLIDVASTVLWLQGISAPDALIGQRWQSGTGERIATATEIPRLVDLDVRSIAQIDTQNEFLQWFTLVTLLYIALALFCWLRRRAGPPLFLSASVAALPVATWLLQLVPWWRIGHWWLVPLTAGFALVVGGLAVLSPWPRDRRWRIIGVVGGLTAAVIAVDAATGSPLSLDAPFGDNPIIAGRFHGIGNVAFALLSTGTLLLAATIAAALRRGRAAAVVFGLGAVAVVIDGYPRLGDDFGGVLALLPAVAVLGLVFSELRISWRHVAAVVGVTVATVAIFALVDYSRPASQRTHVGRFVQQIADGTAWPVIVRKLGSSLATFAHGWPRLITLLWLLVLVAVVVGRRRGRLRLVGGVARRRVGGVVAALVVVGVLGTSLNDSGLAIAAFVCYVSGPLLVPLVDVIPPTDRTSVVAAPDDEQPLPDAPATDRHAGKSVRTG